MCKSQSFTADVSKWQEIYDAQKLMCPRINIIDGEYIGPDGEPASNANFSRTDYIEVNAGDIITFKN